MAALMRSDAIVLCCAVGVLAMGGATVDPPAGASRDAMQGSDTKPMNDDLLVYRGDLWYRGQAVNGAVDLEFRLFATETEALPIAPVVFADQWMVEEGVVLVGLDFGNDIIPSAGAWLEVTANGAILLPRQYVSAPGWSLSGEVTREAGRNARVVESEDFIVDEATDPGSSDSTPEIRAERDSARSSVTPGQDAGRGAVNGDVRRSSLRSRDGSVTADTRFEPGEASLADGRRDDPVELMQFAMNRWFNASGSLFMNIDSDNDNADDQSFQIVKNTATDVGGTTLLRVLENGNVGIGTTTPQAKLDVSGGSIRTSGQLMSTVATGTPPLTVSSTTNVTNLNADLLDGLNSTAFLQSVPVPLTLSGDSGTHIIRGENASTELGSSGVYGSVTSATLGTSYGGYFENASTYGIGVYGLAAAASGGTTGVWGRSESPIGCGVFGISPRDGVVGVSTEFGYGVYGRSLAIGARGVVGWVFATSTPTIGVWGRSDSTAGIGVSGEVSATSGTTSGVFGLSESTSGRGVFGLANAGTGTTNGVFGSSSSTSGRAVYGLATAASGTTYGGRFESRSTNGIGVYGQATATTGTIFGVYGQASTAAAGFAVYAAGDLGASGLKPFRIDHPDDPAHKYLMHYSAESPEVINFYRGNVVLDGSGEALIELPHYFGKINIDPSYMLTAVGAPMPDLHVVEEIDENALNHGAAPVCSFRIAGGVAGGKVCWRVDAVRNDLRMRLHGAPVEVDKQGSERGTYQHPEFYGRPAEVGVTYEPARADDDANGPLVVPRTQQVDHQSRQE